MCTAVLLFKAACSRPAIGCAPVGLVLDDLMICRLNDDLTAITCVTTDHLNLKFFYFKTRQLNSNSIFYFSSVTAIIENKDIYIYWQTLPFFLFKFSLP